MTLDALNDKPGRIALIKIAIAVACLNLACADDSDTINRRSRSHSGEPALCYSQQCVKL